MQDMYLSFLADIIFTKNCILTQSFINRSNTAVIANFSQMYLVQLWFCSTLGTNERAKVAKLCKLFTCDNAEGGKNFLPFYYPVRKVALLRQNLQRISRSVFVACKKLEEFCFYWLPANLFQKKLDQVQTNLVKPYQLENDRFISNLISLQISEPKPSGFLVL